MINDSRFERNGRAFGAERYARENQNPVNLSGKHIIESRNKEVSKTFEKGGDGK